jgi:hypothetical protein
MKKKLFLFTILFNLFLLHLKAQEKADTLPSNSNPKAYGETWFSTYGGGVWSCQGNWIIKEGYYEVLGAVSDVFFASKEKNYSDEKGNYQHLLYISRFDTQGKCLDSIIFNGYPICKLTPSGLCISYMEKPDSLFFLPARGKLIALGIKNNYKEYTGLTNDITVWIEPIKEAESNVLLLKSQNEKDAGIGLINPITDSVLVPLFSESQPQIHLEFIREKNENGVKIPGFLRIRKNGETSWTNIYQDKAYPGCFLLPDSISGLGRDEFLCLPSYIPKKSSLLLNKFLSGRSQNGLSYEKSYLILSPQTAKKIYHAEISQKNIDMLLSEVYFIDAGFRVLKIGNDTIAFNEQNLFISRNCHRFFVSFLTKESKISSGSYEISTCAEIFKSSEGFSAVQKVNNGYRLIFSDCIVENFKQLKIPVKQKDEILYIGRNQAGQIKIVHTLYNGYYEEESPTEAILRGFDDLPDFSCGLPEMLKDSVEYMNLLKTYSPKSIDLIGYLEKGGAMFPSYNPSKLNSDSAIFSLSESREGLIKKVRVTGITSDGIIIDSLINLTPGFYYYSTFSQGSYLPGILKKSNQAYDFFIPCFHFAERETFKKPAFLFSARTRKTYRMENNGILIHLWQSPGLLKNKKFPDKFYGVFYYLFRDGIPVALNDVFNEVHSVIPHGNKLLLKHSSSGFIDKKGNFQIVIPCKEGSCENQNPSFRSGLAAIKTPLIIDGELKSSLHFIDKRGKKAFEKDIICSSDFHDGLAHVLPLKNNHWDRMKSSNASLGIGYGGYITFDMEEYLSEIINTKGEAITKVRTQTLLYKEGYIRNLHPDTILGFGYFNHRNQMLKFIPGYSIRFDNGSVLPVKNGIFSAVERSTGKITFFDLQGNIVLRSNIKYKSSISYGDFSSGMVLLRIPGDPDTLCYLNSAAPPLFKEKKWLQAHEFSEGHAFVKDSTGWYMINKKGERMSREIFEYASDFKEGLAIIKNEKGLLGFLDTLGNIAIKPIYNTVRNFSEGLAFVTEPNGEAYFIDKQGKKQDYPHQFIEASEFSEGLCYASTSGSSSLLDRNGQAELFKEKKSKLLNQHLSEGYSIDYASKNYAVIKRQTDEYTEERKLIIFD